MRQNLLKPFVALFVFILTTPCWACTSWTAYINAEFITAQNQGSQCVVTVKLDYAKLPKTCAINLRPGMQIEIIAPRQLMSVPCGPNYGLYVEGQLQYVNDQIWLVSGELW